MDLSPETHTVADVLRLLHLAPLPHEGGFFRRTAESADLVESPLGRRRAWSAILALFTPDAFSAMHRLRQDEIWCFHAGDPLEIVHLAPDGSGGRVILGRDAERGQHMQDVVPARTWQGARVMPGGRWSLVSCVVAPEFAWNDFEAGRADVLCAAYPQFEDIIRALVRAAPPAQ